MSLSTDHGQLTPNKTPVDKTGVVNDPLDQPTVLELVKICLFWIKILKTDNACEYIVMTTGRNGGSAAWIKNTHFNERGGGEGADD